MEFLRKNSLSLVVLILLVSNFFIWQAVFAGVSKKDLTVAFLDIGQGDSIYIEGPNGGRLLVDAGPNAKILSELGKLMPFGDRYIDVLVITNPDKDHYGGFLDVLEKYKVGVVIEPGVESPNTSWLELQNAIQKEGAQKIVARRGMYIDLGSGANFEIVFPDRDVSNFSHNDSSIVARLEYGSTSVMLTGDTTKIIEEYLVNYYKEDLPSTILKVAHHGSKTSSGKNFVGVVLPQYAVISDGRDNKYGHPNQETLDTLESFGIKIFRTDLDGTITFTSDGESILITSN